MVKKSVTKTKSALKATAPTNQDDNNSKPQESKPEPSVSKATRMVEKWMGICIAILAFAVGIICPPVLDHFQGSISSRISNTTTKHQQRRTTNLLDSHGASSSSSSAIHSISFQTQEARMQQYPCTEERLADFVHDEAVPGFLILCLKYVNHNDNNETSGSSPSLLHLDIRVGGTERTSNGVIHREIETPVTWDAFKLILQDTVSLQPVVKTDFQPWALFTPEGERLIDATTVEDSLSEETIVDILTKDVGMVLAFAGGQWVWPGVRIGFKREISLYSIMPGNPPISFDNKNQTATLETLSLIPLVLSVEGFLTKDECHLIQKLAEPSLQYSGVVLMDKDKGRPASDFRTSQTTFLSSSHKTIVDIDYRTASLTRVPRNHQENVQVLRYDVGEHYDSHHDYFDPQYYQTDKNTLRLIRNGNRNRLATVFWYLSDVAKGGETVFPRFNHGRERSFRDCETGLLVKPQEGKVIIFYSLTAEGKMDQNSLHGACPPKDGIKWAANKWIWNEKMGYLPP